MTASPGTVLVPGPWTRRDVSANGIRLHVAEAGTGPPVLLLPGFPDTWWGWRHQLTGLAGAGFRAIAVDPRGWGGSDKPPRGHDLWTLAGDVAGLVRALGETRVALVGHGWGGIVAWTVAALHPRAVRALAAIAAPHPLALLRCDPAQRRALLPFAACQLPWWPERRLIRDGGALVERAMRRAAGPGWAGTADFAAAAARNRATALQPGAAHCALEHARWAGRSRLRPDGRRFARALDHPLGVAALQVHGAADPVVLESTARASAAWAGAGHEMHVLPDVGHFVPQEAPDRTTTLLVDFLRARCC